MTLRGGASDRQRRFEALVLPHLDVMYRAAVRLTGGQAEAEDLVQEACLKAFAAMDQLRDPGSAKAWLFTILRTTYLRRWGEDPYRRSVVSVADLEGSQGDLREALYDHYENDPAYARLVVADIRRALTGLPHVYSEVVVLAHVAELSYREMARVLGVPLGTVMSRLFRARRMLRASLRDYARVQGPCGSEP